MSELFKIKDATDNMDNLDRGDLDILNEYLHNERWASKYLEPDEDYQDPQQKSFFPTIAAFMNSDQWGRESIKHYLMYRSRFLLSNTK